MPWVYDPHVGGTKIPPAVQERVRARIVAHAAATQAGKYDRIDVRFRGALCYVDATSETKIDGASRSTRTATSGTRRARFRTAVSKARPRTRSTSARSTSSERPRVNDRDASRFPGNCHPLTE